MRLIYLLTFLFMFTPPLSAESEIPYFKINIRQLSCSEISLSAVSRTVQTANAILNKACGLALQQGDYRQIESIMDFCILPGKLSARQRLTGRLNDTQHPADPQAIFWYLMGETENDKISWADTVIASTGDCGQPVDKKDLSFFGNLYTTNLGWNMAEKMNTDQPYYWQALLLLHELIHAGTGLKHPTRQKKGYLMTDLLSDMGPKIRDRDCDCMKQSPYLQK